MYTSEQASRNKNLGIITWVVLKELVAFLVDVPVKSLFEQVEGFLVLLAVQNVYS